MGILDSLAVTKQSEKLSHFWRTPTSVCAGTLRLWWLIDVSISSSPMLSICELGLHWIRSSSCLWSLSATIWIASAHSSLWKHTQSPCFSEGSNSLIQKKHSFLLKEEYTWVSINKHFTYNVNVAFILIWNRRARVWAILTSRQYNVIWVGKPALSANSVSIHWVFICRAAQHLLCRISGAFMFLSMC